jgi:Fe-S-cluster containining protein
MLGGLVEPGDFECLRCGTCCQTILQSDDGVVRGLPLMEKETALFSANAVSPRLAVGVKEPETVVLWQLNTNVCPHLGESNCCQKYATRPLICRSFPIVAGAISNRCKVFSYRKPGVSYKEPYTMTGQVEASDKLTNYIKTCLKRHSKKGLKMWEYNLTTNKWVNEQKI